MSKGFLKGTATITAGTKKLTLNPATIDASFVASGAAVFIGDFPPVEGVSGTIGEIMLRENWTGLDQTNVPFTVIYTIEGLRNAVESAREMSNKYLALLEGQELLLSSTDPTVTLEINGVPTDFAPYSYMYNQVQTLLGSAQTVADDMTIVEGRLDTVETDLTTIEATLDSKVTAAQDEVQKAKDWATSPTEPEVGLKSSKTYATEAGQQVTLAADEVQKAKDEVTLANNAKNQAESAKDVALANANFAGDWTGKTGAVNQPYSVKHDDKIWMLNVTNLAAIENSEPTAVNTDWFVIGTLTSLTPADIGLGNVDNTSDMDKPTSTATQAALDNIEMMTFGAMR